MDPDALVNDEPSLFQGVFWGTGHPELDLVAVHKVAAVKVPLTARRLGFRVVSEERFCTGRYGFVNGTGIERVICPRQAVAASRDQCDECAARDDFRFAHHFHLGGYAPPELVAYMSQPHWVYVATFADATSKVGTAADVRKQSRLDEQGAVRATYVGHAPNGRVARIVEDSITRALDLPQVKRRAAKAQALANPAASEVIQAHHQRIVALASAFLESGAQPEGLELPNEPWEPPAETEKLLTAVPPGGWAAYPDQLGAGEHGFRVLAAAGSFLLAQVGDEESSPAFLVDMDAMKGQRLVLGQFTSRDVMYQTALF